MQSECLRPGSMSWLSVVIFVAWAARAVAYAETATATATVTRGYVSGITLVSGGAGYITEPAVAIEGGGGSGATAKAFLTGDKVGAIIVLNSGSGYTNVPTVIIDVPPKEMTLRVDIVPKITVDGPLGASTLVEYSPTLEGPWAAWTNVTIGRNGTVVVDLAARTTAQFYRSVSAPPGYIWVAPGSFIMGSPPLEPDRVDEEVQHNVILTSGFWMSDHETTQSEYEDLMGTNPSVIKGAELPVDTVRRKAPNPWGFYDLLGNVAEWCGDWTGPYPKIEVTDPSGPRSGRDRSIRGGSYLDDAPLCRSAARVRGDPNSAFQFVGFRPVLAVVR